MTGAHLKYFTSCDGYHIETWRRDAFGKIKVESRLIAINVHYRLVYFYGMFYSALTK